MMQPADTHDLLAPRDNLAGWFLAAILGHVAAVGLLVSIAAWWPDLGPKPFFDPDKVMSVSLASIPKKARLPERATRATPLPPEPETPVETKPTAPVPKPVEKTPAKPKETRRKPKVTGEDRMAALQKELELQAMLEKLRTADEGPKDRLAAGPNGTDDPTLAGLAGEAKGDPEYAAYIARISEIFRVEFRPLPVLTGRGLKTTVLVRVDSKGRVVSRKVARSSGEVAFDRAAEVAVDAVASVPLPPEKYRPLMAQGYSIHFEK